MRLARSVHFLADVPNPPGMMHQHTGQGRVNMCLHTGAGNTIHPLSTTTSITTFTSKAGSTINMEEDTISQPPFPSKPKHLNQEIFPQQRISHPFHTSLTGKSPHSVHSALRDFPRVSMFAHLRRRVLLPVTHCTPSFSRPTR